MTPTSALRRLAWIGAAGLLFVAAMLALVPYVASTRIVSDRIADELGRWSGYRVSIAEPPRLAIFPQLHAVLSGVTFADPRGTIDPPVATAETIDVDLSALAALQGHIDITEARIVRPRLRVREIEGRWKLPPAPVGGRFAAALANLQDVVHQPPMLVQPAQNDQFGTVSIIDGQVVTESNSTLAAHVDGSLTWPELDGPASLTASGSWRGQPFTIDGKVTDPLPLLTGKVSAATLKANLAGASLDFDGQGSLRSDWTLVGALSFTAFDFRQFSESVGLSTLSGNSHNAASFAANVSGGRSLLKLDGVDIGLGQSRGSGAIEISQTGEQPSISGSLAFDRLDFDSLSSGLRSAVLEDVDEDGGQRLPADVDLRLSAGAATAAGVTLSDVAASAQIRRNFAAFDISDAEGLGGTLQASARFERKSGVASATATLTAADLDGAALCKALGIKSFAPSGPARLAVKLKGPGRDLRSMFAYADGTIDAQFGAGSIAGFDLPGFLKRNRDGNFFMLDEVASGSMAVTAVDLKASVVTGVARLEQAEIASASQRITLSGIVSLGERGLAMSGRVEPVADGQTTAAIPGATSFFIGGSWRTPLISPRPSVP